MSDPHWQARPPHSDWRRIAPEFVDEYRAKDWEVRFTGSAPGGGELEALLSAWRMDARQLEEAAEQEDISDEEHTLNKYIARQIRECIGQLERVMWDSRPAVSSPGESNG